MSDMKGKQISECVFKMKELNPYMTVECVPEIPEIKGYNYVISTQTIHEALPVSKICR